MATNYIKLVLFLSIATFGLCLLNCQEDSIVNIQVNGSSIMLDSSALSQKRWKVDTSENYAVYPAFYFGNSTDTIRLAKKEFQRYGPPNFKDYSHIKYVCPPDCSNLSIFVDTAIDLTYSQNFFGQLGLDGRFLLDSIVGFKSHPVIVKNIGDDIFFINDCWILPLIRQAKDKEGQWVDVEEPFQLACGFGCRSIVLSPNEIVVSKLILNEGNTKTENRLRYSRFGNTVYSNTFIEYIDSSQFHISER